MTIKGNRALQLQKKRLPIKTEAQRD